MQGCRKYHSHDPDNRRYPTIPMQVMHAVDDVPVRLKPEFHRAGMRRLVSDIVPVISNDSIYDDLFRHSHERQF
jgi:hypothetical protein